MAYADWRQVACNQPFPSFPEDSPLLAAAAPRLSVHAGGGIPFQAEVRLLQRVRIVDMVQQRREPQPLILLGCMMYPPEGLLHAIPDLRPEQGWPWRVPFGQPPSLRPLRRRWLAQWPLATPLVRGVPWYYGAVRLPLFVQPLTQFDTGFQVKSRAIHLNRKSPGRPLEEC